MNIRPIRVLLGLILLLTGGLTWQWIDPQGRPRNLAWIAPTSITPVFTIPVTLARGDGGANYTLILERPVFAPDRRPPPPPAPPVPPSPPDPLANAQILGIFTGDVAGILARIDGKIRRIHMADNVGAWTLQSIDGRDISFVQGDQTRKLRLAYARLNTAVQPSAPVSSPPPPVRAQMPNGVMPGGRDIQAEMRESLRRRNEARAARGLPLVTE